MSLWIVLGALGSLFTSFAGCAKPQIVRRSPPDTGSYAELVAGELTRVRACLLERLPEALEFRGGLPRFDVAGRGDAIFAVIDSSLSNATRDPALERYLALGESARTWDLFVHDPQDRYWRTEELTAGGRPVLFRSDFLLHLDSMGGKTRVEVIEILPRVWLGKRFSWRGHKGPGWYRDIRPVAPTVEERRRILLLCGETCAEA